MSVDVSYYVSYQGKKMKMKESQMSTKWIGKVFNLYPDSIVLVGDDDTIATPADVGVFSELHRYTDYDVLRESTAIVEQCSSTSSGSSQHAYMPMPRKGLGGKEFPAKIGGKKWHSLSLSRTKTSKPPGVTASNKGKEVVWQKTIEIYSYINSQLEKQLNYPLELSASTANISSVSEVLSAEVFNGESCILLDVDNLKIPDTTTTRGIKYWKGSRRIRAVTEKDYANEHQMGTHDTNDIDLELLDFETTSSYKYKPPPTKKHKVAETPPVDHESLAAGSSTVTSAGIYTSLNSISKRLDELEKRHSSNDELAKAKLTMNAMQKEVSSALGKLEAIASNLKCFICKNFLSTTNSVILPCCENFGCCRPCVNQWLQESATCPHCRASLTISDAIPFPSTRQIPSIVEILQKVEERGGETSGNDVIEL